MKIYGEVFYDVNKGEWSGNGEGWWLARSENNRVKVNFVDPFSMNEAKNYKISISTFCGSAQFEPQNIKVDSFELVCVDYEDELCGAAFTAVGEQSAYFFDDKNLNNEESVADIYAASLLLDYEAKYGYVSVMGSASISAPKTLEAKKDILEQKIENLEEMIDDSEVILDNEDIKEQIKLDEIRKKRQDKIENKSSKYYTSAYEFGKLWGDYCVSEQKEKLYGCYVPLCTGGGPGIMEAAAKGAREQNAHVIGIDCQFGNDNFFNLTDSVYLHSNMRLRMNNFAIREGVLVNYSHVILFWPGGFGTVWEICETLSKLQTKHLRKRRIKAIFVHREYWQPFFDMMAHMREHGTINSYGDRIRIPGVDDHDPDDAYIAEVVESAEDAFKMTRAFVEELADNGDLILRKES